MEEKYSLGFINLINTAEKAQKSAISKIFSSSSNKNVVAGDKCLIERKTPYYFAVAGYHYFLGMKQGDKVSAERLNSLLKTPEFFDYIFENDLAYDEQQENSIRSSIVKPEQRKIQEYRIYITEYYGEKLNQSELFELFYKTNTAMFENQILNYDKWREPDLREKRPNENFYYFNAHQAHDNWWEGHVQYRSKFISFMNRPEIYETWKKEAAEINELYKQGCRMTFPDAHWGFVEIISMLNKDDEDMNGKIEENETKNKVFYMKCLGLDEIFDTEEMIVGLFRLILHEGRPIIGYYGDPYIHKKMGTAEFVLRLEQNKREDNGESYLEVIGCDTHNSNGCVWDTKLVFAGYVPEDNDKLAMRVGVCNAKTESGFAIVNLLNADVLPSYQANECIKMQMAGFAVDVDYYTDEQEYANEVDGILMENGTIIPTTFLQNRNPDSEQYNQLSEYEDINLVAGVVKNLYHGTFENSDEKLDLYIRCEIDTNFGPLEIIHTLDCVKEEQIERFRVGSKVVAQVVLSGDVAIYDYENGIVRNEVNDLKALAYAFENNKAKRLNRLLSDDCQYVSQAGNTAVLGKENVMNHMTDVAQTTSHRYFAHKAYLLDSKHETELSHHEGEKCLVLASDNEDNLESIVFIEYNDSGQISKIELTTDSRYEFYILKNGEDYSDKTMEKLYINIEEDDDILNYIMSGGYDCSVDDFKENDEIDIYSVKGRTVTEEQLIGRNFYHYTYCELDEEQPQPYSFKDFERDFFTIRSNEELVSDYDEDEDVDIIDDYLPSDCWVKRFVDDKNPMLFYLLYLVIDDSGKIVESGCIEEVVQPMMYTMPGLDSPNIKHYDNLWLPPNKVDKELSFLINGRNIPLDFCFIGKRLPKALTGESIDATEYSYALQSAYRLAYMHMGIETDENGLIKEMTYSTYQSNGNAYGDMFSRPVYYSDYSDEALDMLLHVYDMYTDEELLEYQK